MAKKQRKNEMVGSGVGALGGAAAGAYWGAQIGIALGPVGAIAARFRVRS